VVRANGVDAITNFSLTLSLSRWERGFTKKRPGRLTGAFYFTVLERPV
jgi:hypothetical protein